MPNKQQLEAWGRQDLAAAIQRHGGFKHFAAQLDLTFRPSQRRRGKSIQPTAAGTASTESKQVAHCG